MSCRADLRAFQDMGIVLENSMSAAQFELVVQRKAAYFYNNFVLTVCLLTAVSWLTFRMDPVSATTMPTSGLRYLYMFTMPTSHQRKPCQRKALCPCHAGLKKCLCAWCCQMDLSARASVALTLLLAIGVFQLILNEIMPQTGPSPRSEAPVGS